MPRESPKCTPRSTSAGRARRPRRTSAARTRAPRFDQDASVGASTVQAGPQTIHRRGGPDGRARCSRRSWTKISAARSMGVIRPTRVTAVRRAARGAPKCDGQAHRPSAYRHGAHAAPLECVLPRVLRRHVRGASLVLLHLEALCVEPVDVGQSFKDARPASLRGEYPDFGPMLRFARHVALIRGFRAWRAAWCHAEHPPPVAGHAATPLRRRPAGRPARSVSLPPHTPAFSPATVAYAPHRARTGQASHSAAALRRTTTSSLIHSSRPTHGTEPADCWTAPTARHTGPRSGRPASSLGAPGHPDGAASASARWAT